VSWYITDNGSHWVLCKIVSRGLGFVTVELYDGTRARGVARRGLYGDLIESK
jgi:hypothetical protein